MATAIPTCGCLFTTFKNVSGGTLSFGFLPPHGRTLADDEELVVAGDPISAVTRGSYRASKRNHQALAKAIAEGKLDVVSTPCAIVYDENDLASYALGSSSGSPVSIAAEWCSSSL